MIIFAQDYRMFDVIFVNSIGNRVGEILGKVVRVWTEEKIGDGVRGFILDEFFNCMDMFLTETM